MQQALKRGDVGFVCSGVVSAVLAAATAGAASLPKTTLVSVNLGGAASGNQFSRVDTDFEASPISTNGRLVVFTSSATDLASTPKGNLTACNGKPCTDVFVRDVTKGTTTLVSVSKSGTAGGNNSSGYGNNITPNGRFIVFNSSASDLVSTPKGTPQPGTFCQQYTSSCSDVLVRDLNAGTTTAVSMNGSGNATGNGFSDGWAITPNGRFVLLRSEATDLTDIPVPLTSGGEYAEQVYVRDLKTNTTKLASVDNSGTTAANDYAQPAGISANGQVVLFLSFATNLGPKGKGCDPGSCDDVFVHDFKTGGTTMVSVNSAGSAGGDHGGFPTAITPNGQFVLFGSSSTDLTSNPKGATTCAGYPCGDVYVRDLKARTTTLVSVNTSGAAATGSSNSVAITPNGRYVLFTSNAYDLVSTPKGNIAGCLNYSCQDVFVRDLKTGITTMVSVNSGGMAGSNGDSMAAAFSSNGQFVVFTSTASDLVSIPKNTSPTACFGSPCAEVFVRDLKKAKTTLVSVNRFGTAASNGNGPDYGFNQPTLTPSGKFVLFNSYATDLVPLQKGTGPTACGDASSPSPCFDVFVSQVK